MQKQFTILFVILFLLLGFTQLSLAKSKSNFTKGDPALQEYKVHDIGNLQTATSNLGNYSDPMLSMPAFNWPRTTINSYIWEGKLWIGAIMNEDTLVTHSGYGEYEWYPTVGSEFLLGDEVTDPKSDQDSKVVFDDIHTLSGHTSMNLQVYQRGMQWEKADYNDFIIYEYHIFNAGTDTLEQLYVSWNFDCDVSTLLWLSDYYLDDLVGWDATDQFSYMWDADNPDSPEDDTGEFNYPTHQYISPGYVGQKLLYSPSGSASSHTYWNWDNDPDNDIERYAFMSSSEFYSIPDSAYDWRWLQSTGPYTVAPGDTLHIITGIAIGMGLEGLRENINRMESVYNNDFSTDGLLDPAPTSPYGFEYHSYNKGEAYLYWTSNAETDLAGYELYKNSSPFASLSPTETNFTDTTFTGTDVYTITAIDSNASESAFSTADYREIAEITDFLVTDNSYSVKDYPSIAVDNQGNFIICWADNRTGDDIYAQRYNRFRMVEGDNFKVNNDTTNTNQSYPDIIIDNDGNFTICWADYKNNKYDYYDIYAQQYDVNGTPLGDNFKVNDISIIDYYGESVPPSIDVDDNGNFIICWTGDDSLYNVYAQKYDATATPIGANFLADTTNDYWAFSSIAIEPNGNFVISWTSYFYNTNIYARQYDATGMPLTTNFQVNVGEDAYWNSPPAIAIDNNGNFVICWEDQRNEGGTARDIYAQRYDNNGIPIYDNFKVNDIGNVRNDSPSVAFDSNGNFIVCWTDYRYASSPSMFAQRYDNNGTPIGINFQFADEGGVSADVVLWDNHIYNTWLGTNSNNVYANILDWDNPVGIFDIENDREIEIPNKFTLKQNYPNPFNPTTTIEYQLPKSASINIRIYNTLGQLVRTLVNEHKETGHYSIVWNGKDETDKSIASGIYFYTLKVDDEIIISKKMVMLK